MPLGLGVCLFESCAGPKNDKFGGYLKIVWETNKRDERAGPNFIESNGIL